MLMTTRERIFRKENIEENVTKQSRRKHNNDN